MRKLRIITIILIFASFGMTQIFSQIIIKGKVIEENCEELTAVKIFDNHNNLIGETDYNGNFQIELLKDSCKLVFAYIGFELAKIEITDSCNYIEIILLPVAHYDFMTSRKIDRLRKKDYTKLPRIHSLAVEKGIFKNPNICYKRQFEKIKPRLDENKERGKIITKNIKNTFKQLTVGDTVRIPCSFRKENEKLPYTLLLYSSMTDETEFDCVIQSVVLSKLEKGNERKLVIKVIEICGIDNRQTIFDKKELKLGQELELNMTTQKIITKKRTCP